jgi:hypothetical protein
MSDEESRSQDWEALWFLRSIGKMSDWGEEERYMSGTLGQKPGPLEIDTGVPPICQMRIPEAWTGRPSGS